MSDDATIRFTAEEVEKMKAEAVKAGWKAAFDCITDSLGNWLQDEKSDDGRAAYVAIHRLLPEMRRQSPDEYLADLWLGVEDALKARSERDEARKERDRALSELALLTTKT